MTCYIHSTERGGVFFPLFLLVLFVSIVSAGLVAFISITHTNPFSPIFLERTPPEMVWIDEPLGIGADPTSASLSVSDDGAGLDEVIVRLVQNNQPKELQRIAFEERGVADKRIDLSIDPKQLGLREGKIELQVLAFDKTLWSNSMRVPKPLVVNFSKPRIDVVTPQQNAVLGGAELVFYKVLGKRPSLTGVTSNSSMYPGLPAKFWDPSFNHYDDLYLSFFPVPTSFEERRDAMIISARDEIGNSATAPFNYKVRQRGWSSFKVKLSSKEAEAMIAALLPHAQASGIKSKPSGDLATDLGTLLKALARLDESVLSDALSSASKERLWSGAFARPVGGYPANSAGDLRSVVVNDTEILKSAAVGVRFPVGTRATVAAANGGVVAFVGELGLLGKTIVVDHGFGLTTVYAHLSEVAVKEKQRVQKSQGIGRTGRSGFATTEEVYFETRMHGVPVSPNEWWDETWVKDHIEAKVAFVQRALIGAPGE
jgi:murein DD-endopeptidase MepM/ murein hydrolase activator NlpD